MKIIWGKNSWNIISSMNYYECRFIPTSYSSYFSLVLKRSDITQINWPQFNNYNAINVKHKNFKYCNDRKVKNCRSVKFIMSKSMWFFWFNVKMMCEVLKLGPSFISQWNLLKRLLTRRIKNLLLRFFIWWSIFEGNRQLSS